MVAIRFILLLSAATLGGCVLDWDRRWDAGAATDTTPTDAALVDLTDTVPTPLDATRERQVPDTKAPPDSKLAPDSKLPKPSCKTQ